MVELKEKFEQQNLTKSKFHAQKKYEKEENVPGLGPFWEAFLHERYELGKFAFSTNELKPKRKLKILISHHLKKSEMILEITEKGLKGISQND